MLIDLNTIEGKTIFNKKIKKIIKNNEYTYYNKDDIYRFKTKIKDKNTTNNFRLIFIKYNRTPDENEIVLDDGYKSIKIMVLNNKTGLFNKCLKITLEYKIYKNNKIRYRDRIYIDNIDKGTCDIDNKVLSGTYLVKFANYLINKVLNIKSSTITDASRIELCNIIISYSLYTFIKDNKTFYEKAGDFKIYKNTKKKINKELFQNYSYQKFYKNFLNYLLLTKEINFPLSIYLIDFERVFDKNYKGTLNNYIKNLIKNKKECKLATVLELIILITNNIYFDTLPTSINRKKVKKVLDNDFIKLSKTITYIEVMKDLFIKYKK
jgi:hypothetical protein